MTFRFDFIYFIGAAIFFYAGYRQFYLRRNVDQLERTGKLDPNVRYLRMPRGIIREAKLRAPPRRVRARNR